MTRGRPMRDGELEILTRAHRLFADPGPVPSVNAAAEHRFGRATGLGSGTGLQRYRVSAAGQRAALAAAGRVDDAVTAIIAAAGDDHARAHRQTGAVLARAHADTGTEPDTPLARREALRRRAARLHAQRAHVQLARYRASQQRAALRALHYRRRRRGSGPIGFPSGGGRAGAAVRTALSRLGRPYVWGATGPDQFDCSGLTQWAYAQNGIQLGRTTYSQILEGIPVSRDHIRPGDLIFPNVGHVQMAIGNGLVVEAPHAGATVRISRLGSAVAIRRPLG